MLAIHDSTRDCGLTRTANLFEKNHVLHVFVCFVGIAFAVVWTSLLRLCFAGSAPSVWRFENRKATGRKDTRVEGGRKRDVMLHPAPESVLAPSSKAKDLLVPSKKNAPSDAAPSVLAQAVWRNPTSRPIVEPR